MRHHVHFRNHDGDQVKKLLILAFFLRKYPDQLRADFQQYYGLNLDEMGGAYGIGHAACLAAQLTGESRTIAAHAKTMEERGVDGKTQGESLPIDEYMEILARPRKEMQHGG